MTQRFSHLAVFVLLVALTGCRTAESGGPPPGGWPQPAGDRLTEAMCGLLTDADYTRLGHARQAKTSGSVAVRANSLDCQYRSNDEMSLDLVPTAGFAKYVFAAGLKDHRGQLAERHRRPALVSGVIGAADESWFDYWTLGDADDRPVAHEIRVRRGALILGITLSGVRGKREKDPRSVLVDLAGLVLRRLPHVGAKDTGTPHRIEYEVMGTGRAKQIQWTDYTGVQSAGTLTGARLPWARTVPMAAADGTQPDMPDVSAETSSPTAKVGCLIVVDGVPVAAQRPQRRFVRCQGTFPDAGDDTQPASFRGPFTASSE
ncbi:MmpS family transport accessory protein [Actinomadura sp. DC4]|uniref:MmpS family transport accessory protein n=1 Tax=Actinomadura sp. DC4 TaxID=3055069 RepID=UPI0025AF42E9|nr:MmpS family transport accessory protein [Actinomadura sp. DC4]MDN3353407.1 MmpS family transport accessory protein [Actinomadura sp. DC4]